VASAGTAVANFLKSVGGTNEDRTRNAAAVALHDAWTTLVSRQPARSSNDRALIKLRSISRELHRLFAEGINAGALFIAVEARSKADASKREETENLPLGRHGFAQSLQEALVWPSPILVVSLRIGLAAGLAGLVGAALGLDRAYWTVAAAVLFCTKAWIGTAVFNAA